MDSTFFDTLRPKKILFENKIQNILIAESKIDNNIYIVNSIFNFKPFKDFDPNILIEKTRSIVWVEERDDILYIISAKLEGKKLKQYVNSNVKTLSKKIKYTEKLFEFLDNLKYLPSHIIASLLDEKNIIISEEEQLETLGVIPIDESYFNVDIDIVFDILADYLFMIYSEGDNKIDIDELPPDISNIIKSIRNREYSQYTDVYRDFKRSKLYNLIHPTKSEENDYYKEKNYKKKSENDEVEENYKAREIFLNKKPSFNIRKKVLFIFLIVVLILPVTVLGVEAIINNTKKEKNKDSNIQQESQNAELSLKVEEKVNEELDDLSPFINNKLMKESTDDYKGHLDDTRYYKGTKSIKLFNQSTKMNKFLSGIIDLNNNDYKVLREESTDLSLWLNSSLGQKALICLEYVKNDETIEEKTKKVYISKDTWSMYNMTLNPVEADYIKIYITLYDRSNLWVDYIDIRILK